MIENCGIHEAQGDGDRLRCESARRIWVSQLFSPGWMELEGEETPLEKIEKKAHCLSPASKWDH